MSDTHLEALQDLRQEIRQKYEKFARWYDLMDGVPEVLGARSLRRRLLHRASWCDLSVSIISMFFGIVIRMFYNEHELAHFRAECQGQREKFDLDGEMVVVNVHSKTTLRLIKEWASLHRREIKANWENMKRGRPMESIGPLE